MNTQERRLQNLVQTLQDATRDEQEAENYAEDIAKRMIAIQRALAAVKAELLRSNSRI